MKALEQEILLRQMAREEMARCEMVLRQAGLVFVLASGIEVRCDIRGRVRGWALYRERVIRLNLSYHAQLGERYRQTVAHEYAHIVQRAQESLLRLRHERSHGPRWQGLMRLFGYPPERVSSYDVAVPKARRTRKYYYRCVNAGHELRATPREHKRLQAGVTGYCPKCRRDRPLHECGLAFDREEVS